MFLIGNARSSSAAYSALLLNFIIFIVIAFFDTPLCLNILLLILPFKNTLMQYEISGVTLNQYSAGLIALTIVIFFKLLHRRLRYQFELLDLLMIAFAVFCLTFFYTSSDIIKSSRVYLHTVFLPFLSYVIIKIIITDKNKYISAKNHIIVSLFVFSVLSIVNWIGTGGRAGLEGANILAERSLLILTIFFLLSNRSLIQIPLVVTKFAAFVLGFSRSYLVSFVISPIFYYIFKRGYFRSCIILISFFSLIFTLTLAIWYSDKTQGIRKLEAEMQREYKDNYSQARMGVTRVTDLRQWEKRFYSSGSVWALDLKNFLDNSIIGSGIGDTYVTTNASSHNLHVQLLAYNGIIGYLLFHAIFILGFPRGIIKCKENVLNRDIIFFSILMMILYVNGITNGLFHGSFNKILFLAMGFSIALRNIILKTRIDN